MVGIALLGLSLECLAAPETPTTQGAQAAPATTSPPTTEAPAAPASPPTDATGPTPIATAPASQADESVITIGPDGVPRSEDGIPLSHPQSMTPEQRAEAEQDAQVPDTDPSALNDFNEPLAPYGLWVDDPQYGRIWVPHASAVGLQFAPYVTAGRWALTADQQWIWVSDYPFGWVVFHYGRWTWAPTYGWVWIPGRRYSHAWVTFRTSYYGDAYLGWAPMPPRFVWRGGAAVFIGTAAPIPYVFCPTRYIWYPNVRRHVIFERDRVSHLARRSTRYLPPRGRRGYYYSPPLRVLGKDESFAPVTRTRPSTKSVAVRRLSSIGSSPARSLTQTGLKPVGSPQTPIPRAAGRVTRSPRPRSSGGASASGKRSLRTPATRRSTSRPSAPPRSKAPSDRQGAKRRPSRSTQHSRSTTAKPSRAKPAKPTRQPRRQMAPVRQRMAPTRFPSTPPPRFHSHPSRKR
jgi:hypothetical protein